MSKWMSKNFIKSKGADVQKNLSSTLKKLGEEYQEIKLSDLPEFIKKVYDFVPKANRYEISMINLLDPQIIHTRELTAVDETAEKKFFDTIKVYANIPEEVDIDNAGLGVGAIIPRCVSFFKEGENAYEDDIVEEENETEEEKKEDKKSSETSSDSSAGAAGADADGSNK
jgi:hypothetical protein